MSILMLIGILALGYGLWALTIAALPWRTRIDVLLHPTGAASAGREKRTRVRVAVSRRWAVLLGLAPNTEESLLRARVLSIVLALGGFLVMTAALGTPFMGLIGAVGMWILPEVVGGRAAAAQRTLLDRQTRSFLRRYKAARVTRDSALGAMEYTVLHTPDPLRTFAEKALADYAAGAAPLWESMARIARDIGNRDLLSFSRILRQDFESGGKITAAVGTVLEAGRMRDFARRQKRIATGASKSGFMVLLPLPVLVILAERLFVPQFFDILKNTVGGEVVLGINAGLILVTVAVLRGYILKGT